MQALQHLAGPVPEAAQFDDLSGLSDMAHSIRKGYVPPRLTRSTTNAMATGVLSGLGRFFGVDPTWLRIAYALGTIFTSVVPGIAVYAILTLIIPGMSDTHLPEGDVRHPPSGRVCHGMSDTHLPEGSATGCQRMSDVRGCQTPTFRRMSEDVRRPPSPTFRKRRPRALCVFEMTGGTGFARNERATGGWIRRWVSEIPGV